MEVRNCIEIILICVKVVSILVCGMLKCSLSRSIDDIYEVPLAPAIMIAIEDIFQPLL